MMDEIDLLDGFSSLACESSIFRKLPFSAERYTFLICDPEVLFYQKTSS